jgi:hypothetical protein
VVSRIRAELAAAPEFEGDVADDFILVLKAVVYFLAARLDAPKPYQREDAKGAAALEADLQEDLFDWLRSGALTHGLPVYEPQLVGGGRADIVVAFSTHRVVNELKRETKDSRRESMEAHYAEQGSSYDAADYPFGIVTVLDVSCEPSTTPRLNSCVWLHKHDENGYKRWLIFVRVPGRLSTPSAHTRRAASQQVSRPA